MNEITKSPIKGRFLKGVSGNPAGRPKGSRNRITMMKEVLEGELRSQLGPQMAQVLAKAIELALDGNESMIKLLVDKTVPTTKANDSEDGRADNKIQINIGRLPERKEDVGTVINGEVLNG